MGWGVVIVVYRFQVVVDKYIGLVLDINDPVLNVLTEVYSTVKNKN